MPLGYTKEQAEFPKVLSEGVTRFYWADTEEVTSPSSFPCPAGFWRVPVAEMATVRMSSAEVPRDPSRRRNPSSAPREDPAAPEPAAAPKPAAAPSPAAVLWQTK